MQNFQRKDIKRAHISNMLPFKKSRSCILTFNEIWVIKKSITEFGNNLRSSFQYVLLNYDLVRWYCLNGLPYFKEFEWYNYNSNINQQI